MGIIKTVTSIDDKCVCTVLFTKMLNIYSVTIQLDVTSGTLGVLSYLKRHLISFIKVWGLVKYRKSELDVFLDEQTVEAGGM